MQSNVLIDWITFSTRKDDVHSIIEFLGLTDQEFKKASGRYYYGASWRFGGINIYCDGLSSDMGICVEMSGQGCRDFETFGTGDWQSVFSYICNNRSLVNVSRLDVAYDDFDRLLDMDKLIFDTFAHNYTSKLKHWNVQKGSRGATVEHGDRAGSFYVRIYDKRAERKRTDLEYWCRCEIQMREKLPCNFIEAVYHGVSIERLYFEVLNNYIRYVEPSETDTNKRRWKTAEHWQEFIQYGESRSIFVAPGVDYNMLGLQHYVFDMAGNAIRTYIDIEGIESFQNMLKSVKKSKNPKYELLRARALADGEDNG